MIRVDPPHPKPGDLRRVFKRAWFPYEIGKKPDGRILVGYLGEKYTSEQEFQCRRPFPAAWVEIACWRGWTK